MEDIRSFWHVLNLELMEKILSAVEVSGLFPTIYKVFLQIPGGCLGFLPSTVLRYHDIYIYNALHPFRM